MPYDMTYAQKKVFVFVKKFMEKNGYPPTRTEIKDALGYASANAAQEHLVALQAKGFITLVPAISRGIRITSNAVG